MPKNKHSHMIGTPVAEGVRMEYGDATAYAVRNESKSITVRVRKEKHFFRNLLLNIPLVRGVARLLFAIIRFFAGINESAELKPQRVTKATRPVRRFTALFRTHPQSLAALGSALLIPIILGAMIIALPMGVEWVLTQIPELPRFVVNALCCMFRIGGSLLAIYCICRVRLLNRLCKYRGAIAKLQNAYEAYGENLSHEEVVLSSRLSDSSDGAFAILVMVLSMIAFACVRIDGIWVQLAFRIGAIFAIAAVSNEFLLPMERASEHHWLTDLRQPIVYLQHLFTIEPSNQMIEAAICAFYAARDNSET